MTSDEFELKVFKCRNVKTPTKAWDAAGWDFYIPEDLSIFDFAESYKAYLDDSVAYDRSMVYHIPLVFCMKSARTVGEFRAQLVLKWNEATGEWAFGVIDFSAKSEGALVDFSEVDSRIMKWLTEDGTVVSKIEILPHASVNIPSGVHVNLPEGVFLQAANKSGIGSKRRLSFLAEVIDCDYEGEIHLNLINLSELTVTVRAGEKIIQMLPMFQPKMREAREYGSLEDLYRGKKSGRGAGGFGSSGV